MANFDEYKNYPSWAWSGVNPAMATTDIARPNFDTLDNLQSPTTMTPNVATMPANQITQREQNAMVGSLGTSGRMPPSAYNEIQRPEGASVNVARPLSKMSDVQIAKDFGIPLSAKSKMLAIRTRLAENERQAAETAALKDKDIEVEQTKLAQRVIPAQIYAQSRLSQQEMKGQQSLEQIKAEGENADKLAKFNAKQVAANLRSRGKFVGTKEAAQLQTQELEKIQKTEEIKGNFQVALELERRISAAKLEQQKQEFEANKVTKKGITRDQYGQSIIETTSTTGAPSEGAAGDTNNNGVPDADDARHGKLILAMQRFDSLPEGSPLRTPQAVANYDKWKMDLSELRTKYKGKLSGE